MKVKQLKPVHPLSFTDYYIYSDASYGPGHKYISIGINVRRGNTKLILGFAKYINLKLNQSQIFNSHHAEGLGLLFGLMVARDIFTDFSYSHAIILSDDMGLVKWIKGASPGSTILHGLGGLRRILPKLYHNLANTHQLSINWANRNTEGIRYSHQLANKCRLEFSS